MIVGACGHPLGRSFMKPGIFESSSMQILNSYLDPERRCREARNREAGCPRHSELRHPLAHDAGLRLVDRSPVFAGSKGEDSTCLESSCWQLPSVSSFS